MVINIDDSLLIPLLLFGFVLYWFLHYLIDFIIQIIKYTIVHHK